MEKFIIALEETVAEEFEVEANNAEEAMEIAEEKYRNGKFVLHPQEVHFKQMAVVHPSSDATEWIEF